MTLNGANWSEDIHLLPSGLRMVPSMLIGELKRFLIIGYLLLEIGIV
jgi:hypothetical protein